jgi:N-acyl homoserine lactone hydrolase
MDISVTPIDRGGVHIDVNRVIEGFVTASMDEPNPDLLYAEGPVYNLVIEHPEATVLWDTGCHPGAMDGHWPERIVQGFGPAETPPLEASLADAGYTLTDVDCVVGTHLHFDHAGGLEAFAGTDTPVVVHETELKHAYYASATDSDLAYVRGDFDHDLNWQVVHGDSHTLYPGVELLHLPGHTPGLLGAFIDRPDPLILTSDLAYVAANYEGERPLGAGLLWSKRDWYDSLRRVKELERTTDATVIYGHDGRQVERFDDLL